MTLPHTLIPSPSSAEAWDSECDVLVVGSGAGGMTAALIAHDSGLDVLLIEKSDQLGGTTAVSGGAVWIPGHHLMDQAGYADSPGEARTYLKETVGDDYDDALVTAYLDTGPELIRYLERNSHVAFQSGPLPDYFSNRPGGKDGHRALDPLPLPARALGDDLARLRPPHPQTVIFGMTFTTGEVATILRRDKGWIGTVARRAAKQYLGRPWAPRRRGSPRLTLGNALIGRLLLSLRDRKVPIRCGVALRELVVEKDRVVGALVTTDGGTARIRARRGVILTAGGFGANPQMRARYLTRAPDVLRSMAPAENTGDAIAAGMQIGADTRLMDEAWWIPVYRMAEAGVTNGMFMERAFPGSVLVDSNGQRFTNDAANYDDVGRAMANSASRPGGSQAFFFVFDERFRRNYIAGPLLPMPAPADQLLSADAKRVVTRARTLPALADALGVPRDGLATTVARFNAFARDGVDPDFHRGEERYDRHYSDPKIGPNSTMAPIEQPPFYAIRVQAGDIGTKGGLRTDRDARVLDTMGAVIPGLYAAGNSAASMMGRSYPAGGVTIGPAMVFGARAAHHIARGLEQ